MDYLIHLGILVCLYLMLAQGLNLTLGLGRLLNLAHIAAYAIGAYVTALLAVNFGCNPILCLLASAALSAIVALLLGYISLRLSGDNFTVGTLAFSALVSALLINWRSVTRGVLGIPNIPRPPLGAEGWSNNNLHFLLIASVVTLLVMTAMYAVFHSPFARRLKAQAENPYAAALLAQNVVRTRILSFVISALCAGLSGSLFAYYMNFIDPSSFGFGEMVFLISMVIVGRPGSFWGVTCAAIGLVLLPETLRLLDLPAGVVGPARQLLYAVFLFAIVSWLRNSLFPAQREI